MLEVARTGEGSTAVEAGVKEEKLVGFEDWRFRVKI